MKRSGIEQRHQGQRLQFGLSIVTSARMNSLNEVMNWKIMTTESAGQLMGMKMRQQMANAMRRRERCLLQFLGQLSKKLRRMMIANGVPSAV